MSVYWSAFKMRVKLETQYRAAALGGLVTQGFFGLILVYLYRALYGAGAPLATLEATATYVWIQQAFFRMVLSSEGELTQTIVKGDMAYQLVRPVDQYGFWFARIAAMKLTGSIMRAIPLLLIAALLPRGVGISLPFSLPALLAALLALALGLLTVTAVNAISCGFILLTLDNRGVSAMIALLTTFFCGNIVPLTLMPDSWQRVIGLMPFSQILDTPIRLYTGEYALTALPQTVLIQLFWVALLVLGGRLLWRRTLRRIVVQGG